MHHVVKENHTIDFEGVKLPTRETDRTAREVRESVKIIKTGSHAMNRDGGHHHQQSLYFKLLVKYISTDDAGSLVR